jgi:hypothetical protein
MNEPCEPLADKEGHSHHGSIETIAIDHLRPRSGNARTHSKKQIRQIAASIEKFGFTNPVLISDDNEIIAGHGRVEAAKLLGWKSVPTLRLSHLDAIQRRAYVIADNKVALNAGWDRDLLAAELQGLIDLDFDVEVTGFSLPEIDLVLEEAHDASTEAGGCPEDQIPPLAETGVTVSLPGDLWLLGRHRLMCGDPRSAASFDRLLQGDRADFVFTGAPYGESIAAHVRGLGRIDHREFAIGGGAMSPEAFTMFLRETLGHTASFCRDGAIAFVSIDWRHIGELLAAGQAVFSGLKDLCVWNKSSSGTGGFYPGKHELIFVFKVGDAPHTSNIGLGATGRARTNVWDYAGVDAMLRASADELAMLPTVKPVALVADAITDCSRCGEIVLDPFASFGTTVVAAEKTGRRARAIELDPSCCDQIVRRYARVTGQRARLEATGQTFEAVAAWRGPGLGQATG